MEERPKPVQALLVLMPVKEPRRILAMGAGGGGALGATRASNAQPNHVFLAQPGVACSTEKLVEAVGEGEEGLSRGRGGLRRRGQGGRLRQVIFSGQQNRR